VNGAKEHNRIFERLGADGDDLERLVAYALYKQHKRRWAREFEEREGRRPTGDDDEAFARAVGTVDQLDRYRQNAQDLIIAFADSILEDARPEIEKGAITARVEAAVGKIEGFSAFWRQVASGLLSSIITTAILIILTLAVAFFGIDLVDGVSQFLPADLPQ